MPMRPVAVRNVFDKKRALPRMVSLPSNLPAQAPLGRFESGD
jgi:hypothetical protein